MDRYVHYKSCSANKRSSVLQRLLTFKYNLHWKIHYYIWLVIWLWIWLSLEQNLTLFRRGNTAFKPHLKAYPNLCVCCVGLSVIHSYFPILSESFRVCFNIASSLIPGLRAHSSPCLHPFSLNFSSTFAVWLHLSSRPWRALSPKPCAQGQGIFTSRISLSSSKMSYNITLFIFMHDTCIWFNFYQILVTNNCLFAGLLKYNRHT